ncbi:MAG: sulfatase [Elusimicrobiota bacterium]
MRILYIDIDTLRPDHLGCYGYQRQTSPNIDKLAAEGVTFTNYYCTDAPCLPSRAALMTGRFGIHNGVVNHGGTTAELKWDGPSRGFRDLLYTDGLFGMLKNAGLYTALISPFPGRHSAYWYTAGLNELHDTGNGGLERADEIIPTALKWLDDNAKNDDWYLMVHLWDPHTPYRTPESYGNPFKDVPAPEWLTQEMLDKFRSEPHPHGFREISMFDNKTKKQWPNHPGEVSNLEEYKRLVSLYDCGVHYADYYTGLILNNLKTQGVLEDTMIIISSDHGENLGELGLCSEHATADYNTCRIPMVIKLPGTKKKIKDDGLYYNIDLLPTLAEVLNQPVSNRWDGKSYLSVLKNGKSCGREYVVVSQNAHVCQRGVRFGDWMYIRTWHDGYHLFPNEMLFNIKTDPHETKDMAKEHTNICATGARYLQEWRDEMMKSNTDNIDPMETVLEEGGPLHARGYLLRYCKYLEETGRGKYITELKKRHPQEFVTSVVSQSSEQKHK